VDLGPIVAAINGANPPDNPTPPVPPVVPAFQPYTLAAALADLESVKDSLSYALKANQ